MLKKISIITQDLLFSRYCYLCLKPRSHLFPFCRPCLKRLPFIHHQCPKCGIELLTSQLCGQCLQKRSPLQQTIATFRYDGLLRDAILQLKHHQGLYLAKPFAKLMHQKLTQQYQDEANWPSALVSVPQHKYKFFIRGFNPAYELSRQLSYLTGLPELSSYVKKIKLTKDQSSLPLKQRRKNIKQAFEIVGPLPKHIAIIDDVMTTGETVKQLASTLRKHGVRKIDVWCLARTPPPNMGMI